MQALELESLSTSHKWTIRPCSARYSPLPDSAKVAVADPRIAKGLDWVVTEVASRVYYGTTPPMELGTQAVEA